MGKTLQEQLQDVKPAEPTPVHAGRARRYVREMEVKTLRALKPELQQLVNNLRSAEGPELYVRLKRGNRQLAAQLMELLRRVDPELAASLALYEVKGRR